MRTAVVAAVSAFAIGATVPSAPAADSQTIELLVSADTNIQDLWEKTLIPAFVKDNPGYKVNVTFDKSGVHDPQNIAKIAAAKVTRRDPGIDIVDGGISQQLGLAGLLYRPSPTLMPNLKDVPKILVKAGNGAFPYRASAVLLAYNSTKVTNPPKTLDELLTWIKANPGKFTYNVPSGGGSGFAFVQTVIDKYLTVDEQTTLQTTPNKELQAKWATGLETLRSLNKYTYGQNGTYPANNAETLKDLSTGLVDMGTVWSDQFVSAQKAGTMPANIKVVQINKPALTGGPAYLGIPINGANRTGARVLANWVLSPTAQNLIAGGALSGIPVIPNTKLDPKVAAAFKDTDVASLRAGYLSANASDLKSAWALAVPGK
jgi:putative spermidine/putrescine transport system substrate-binding protein